jgi:hypothetical protein
LNSVVRPLMTPVTHQAVPHRVRWPTTAEHLPLIQSTYQNDKNTRFSNSPKNAKDGSDDGRKHRNGIAILHLRLDMRRESSSPLRFDVGR